MADTSPKDTAYKPDDWLHRTIDWHLIRGFGNTNVATVTLAVPFVGYAILYHSQLEPYLRDLGGLGLGESPGACRPYLSFLTRLHMLYFGGLALGAGTLLYRLCAHAVIKRSDGLTEYVEKQLSILTPRTMRSMFVTIASRRPSVAKQLKVRAPWLHREVDIKVASDAVSAIKDNTIALDVLRSYYTVLNKYSMRGFLYAALLLYTFGFLLLILPGAAFSLRVVCSMIY